MLTGERDLDALHQHRLCHHLRHRACNRTQWVCPRQWLFTHTHWLQQGAPLAEVLFGCEQTCNDICCKSETWASWLWPSRLMMCFQCFGCGWPHLWDLSRSHSLCGDHWDVQAVGQARRLYGRRLRPLALQLHCWPHLPLPRGQLHNF